MGDTDFNGFETLKAGDVDPELNKTIKDVIMSSPHFIVYMDTESTIQWGTSNETNSNFDKIQNQVTYWELICNKIFEPKDAYSYKALLAEGLARILDGGDIKDAQAAIDNATEVIKKQGEPRLRQAYIRGSTRTALPLFVILVAGLLFGWSGAKGIGLSDNAIEFILTGLLGGIGAFISTMTGVTKYAPDISISEGIYRIDGSLRIIYGVLAGALIALGIKANIIFGFIATSHNIYALAFLSAIGGASEKMIPNIIKKIEEQSTKE